MKLRQSVNQDHLRNSFISLLFFLFDSGTQFPGNEKITLCNTKKYIKLLLLLLLLLMLSIEPAQKLSRSDIFRKA